MIHNVSPVWTMAARGHGGWGRCTSRVRWTRSQSMSDLMILMWGISSNPFKSVWHPECAEICWNMLSQCWVLNFWSSCLLFSFRNALFLERALCTWSSRTWSSLCTWMSTIEVASWTRAPRPPNHRTFAVQCFFLAAREFPVASIDADLNSNADCWFLLCVHKRNTCDNVLGKCYKWVAVTTQLGRSPALADSTLYHDAEVGLWSHETTQWYIEKS